MASPQIPSRARELKRLCPLAGAALCWLTVASFASDGPAPDLWPLPVKVLSAPALQQEGARIDAAAAMLAPELKPAVRFEKVFLQIVSGVPENTWLPDLQGFVAAAANMPTAPATMSAAVPRGIAEVSRAWIARCQMRQIDGVLRQYYRKHVAFPEHLAAVELALPDSMRRDPWGQPWIYQSHAPAGLGERFARFTTQRYRLGPTRAPELGTLAEAIGDRNPPGVTWKITVRELGGRAALEFRAGGVVTAIEPGGRIGAFTLLFIGDRWALMAGVDQLFTVAFL